jgi:N-acetylneuraminate synthase
LKNFRAQLVDGADEGQPKGCLIIAEVAQNHDGSLGMAHAFVDAVADTGADAVKFQTHIARAESTPAEPWRVPLGTQDASRFEYWKRMEFSPEQWQGLKDHADQRGLVFLSSPFSLEAVDLLHRIGVKAWKIASGEVSNQPMLERMAETNLPLILSTGMSRLAELDRLMEWAKARAPAVAILQCTSMYPCPPDKIGINMIPLFRRRYETYAGLSDHSGTIFPGLASVALGADVLEIHVTLSREMFGPDVSSSITTTELNQLVTGVRFIEGMLDAPVDKDHMASELSPVREIFSKSIVAREDLSAGTVLDEKSLCVKKPGGGLAPDRLPEVLGRVLVRDLKADEKLTDLHLESLE